MGTQGTLWGRVRGSFCPPAINICIFFFYPACKYGRGREGSVPAAVLGHRGGTPKCPEMPLAWARGNGEPGLGVSHGARWPVIGCPEQVSGRHGHRGVPGRGTQGCPRGDAGIGTKPWEWGQILLVKPTEVVPGEAVAGDISGCPPGLGHPGGGDLCILCMKINLFSQYLYLVAVAWCPLPPALSPNCQCPQGG